MPVLRSRNVVGHGAASIHITGERIAAIRAWDDVPENCDDYGDLALMPGVVDAHVHINEPGRTEWEGFETATRAAIVGGVTTLVDMPLNSIPPTTSVAKMMEKVGAMNGKCCADVGLWGGAVPGNTRDLLPMLDAGVLGFKCFLVDSGVPEFGHLDERGLHAALHTLSVTGAPLLVHAELPGPLAAAQPTGGSAQSYRRYLASRPRSAEDEAIALVVKLARATGAHAHIVHLSSASALPLIRRARAGDVPITAETTPHYLTLDAESIPDGAPQYKCAPPIRERENRELLWDGLADGTIASIVSDHSPCTPELKLLDQGDVEHAWGGIASLQLALPIVWTAALRRAVPLEEVVRLMCEAPARLAGISDRKGALAAGMDADIVAFDPTASFTVTPAMIEHRHKVTPYEGMELHGAVNAVWLRGMKVWENGAHIGSPRGTWLAGRAAAAVSE